jgi:NitT/TauT family transport system substrate-binding protein
MEKLLSGQAQFATSADTPLMFASLKDPRFSILASLTTSSMENRIVVRTDRGIRTVVDLRRKRIGAIKGTSSHYFMSSVLTYNGFAAGDAAISWLDPADLNGPIVRGEIDAVSVFGTQVHDVLRDLRGRGVALPPVRYFSVIFNLVSAPRSPGVREEDDMKVLRALRRAEDYMRKNREQSITIMAEALKVERPAIAATWGHYEFRLHLGQALVHVMESQFRWAARESLIPAATPMPDFLDLLRPGPLRQVDARAVRLVQ